MEITTEQKMQLATWAEQRDSILLEISNLRTEKEKLESINKELAESNSDIEIRMNEIVGRIDELLKKEIDLIPLRLKEVSDLESRKTCLESEITSLDNLIKRLQPQKDNLEVSIAFLTDTFKSINDRVGLLDKVIGHVTQISDKNIIVIENFVSSLKKEIQVLIDLNKVNVDKTNFVISELPKVFLEVQRKSLIREKIN